MPSVIRHAAAAPTALHSQVPTGNRGQAGEGGKWVPNCSFTTIITVFAPLSPSATRAIGVREVGDRADSLIVWALLALLWIILAAIIRMETFIPIRAANPRRRAQTSHCIEFDCHFEFQMALEPASLSHVPWKVSQRVQPRPFLMTEMPECSVSLTTGRKEGGGRDGKEEEERLLEPRPCECHLNSEIAREHSAANGRSFAGRMRPCGLPLPLKRDAFRLRAACLVAAEGSITCSTYLDAPPVGRNVSAGMAGTSRIHVASLFPAITGPCLA